MTDELDNPDPIRAEEAFGGPVRKCRECLEYLPADRDFFLPAKSKVGIGRLCRACWSDLYGERERLRLAVKNLRDRPRRDMV